HRLVVRAGDPAEAAHRAERLADLVGEALERAGGVAVLDQGGEVSDAPGAAVGGFAGRAALFDEARPIVGACVGSRAFRQLEEVIDLHHAYGRTPQVQCDVARTA